MAKKYPAPHPVQTTVTGGESNFKTRARIVLADPRQPELGWKIAEVQR